MNKVNLPPALRRLNEDAERAERERIETEHGKLREERTVLADRRAARAADTRRQLAEFDAELTRLAVAMAAVAERRQVFETARQQEAERLFDGRDREIAAILRGSIGEVDIDFVGRPKVATA